MLAMLVRMNVACAPPFASYADKGIITGCTAQCGTHTVAFYSRCIRTIGWREGEKKGLSEMFRYLTRGCSVVFANSGIGKSFKAIKVLHVYSYVPNLYVTFLNRYQIRNFRETI